MEAVSADIAGEIARLEDVHLAEEERIVFLRDAIPPAMDVLRAVLGTVIAVLLPEPVGSDATYPYYLPVGQQRIVKQIRMLRQVVSGVDPKAIKPTLEPEPEDRINLAPNGFVLPVEVWLIGGKEV